jgi:hypothetical protein
MGGGSGNVLQFLSRPILSGVPGLGDLKSLLALLSLCPRVSLDDVYDDLVMVLLDVALATRSGVEGVCEAEKPPLLTNCSPFEQNIAAAWR